MVIGSSVMLSHVRSGKTCSCFAEEDAASLFRAVVAEGLKHHFTPMSCNPEYTVGDIISDVIPWKTHPRDIYLAECEVKITDKNDM